MSLSERQRRLDEAVRITGIAAEITLRHFRRALAVDYKDDRTPVTAADREAEQAIRQELARIFPGDGIFGEEFGKAEGEGGRMWIVDPIDGTKSFVAGLPMFGMLLGSLLDGAPELGVVRMPALGEVFAGAPGLGATLNGEPISASSVRALDQAVLFINDGDRIHKADPALFARLVGAGRIRRLASDCYGHALVAAGRADAAVDFGLEAYDYLPIAPVIEAAGGIMTDWQGKRVHLGSDGQIITAATPGLHQALLSLINN